MKKLNLKNASYKVIVQDFKQWLDILGFAETTVYNLPIHLKGVSKTGLKTNRRI